MQHSAANYRAVLFDLDGTLTDPVEGITRSIQYALEKLGKPVPSQAVLHSWIGPDLAGSFMTYFQTQDKALGRQAVAIFRERFGTIGLFENKVYPGIPELLAALRAAGCKLILATGKPTAYAEKILTHFELSPYFTLVGGAFFDGRLTDKRELLETLLPQLSAEEQAACVMVGDREHDVYGAKAHGIPSIAVTYGYGSAEELVACEPTFTASSVAELRTLLLRGSA